MARDKKYGLFVIPNEPKDTTQPEPIFIIRGKDKASVQAIFAYATAARSVGCSSELFRDVTERAAEFDKWQKDNPDVVKVPD